MCRYWAEDTGHTQGITLWSKQYSRTDIMNTLTHRPPNSWALASPDHTVTFSFSVISAANLRKVYSTKVILRRVAMEIKTERRRFGDTYFNSSSFTCFPGSRVVQGNARPRPPCRRFDSDTWPLPQPLSCVIPHLSPAGLPVDPLPNNEEMPWR